MELKRKQALLESNLSAIDSMRYTVTGLGLSNHSPFSVRLSANCYGLCPMAKKTQPHDKFLNDNLR